MQRYDAQNSQVCDCGTLKKICLCVCLSMVNAKQTSLCSWDLSMKSTTQLLATRIGKLFTHFLPREVGIQEFRATYVCSERRRNQRYHRLIHDSRHLREQKCDAFGASAEPWHGWRGGFWDIVFHLACCCLFVKVLIVSHVEGRGCGLPFSFQFFQLIFEGCTFLAFYI